MEEVQGREGAASILEEAVEIRVPMAEAFLAEDEQLVELTREQALALRRLARNHRMAIYGCAGSGKTMLAVEHARRLAQAGQQVLFVCFNAQLRAQLVVALEAYLLVLDRDGDLDVLGDDVPPETQVAA